MSKYLLLLGIIVCATCLCAQGYWIARWFIEWDSPLRTELLIGAWTVSLPSGLIFAAAGWYGKECLVSHRRLATVVIIEAALGMILFLSVLAADL